MAKKPNISRLVSAIRGANVPEKLDRADRRAMPAPVERYTEMERNLLLQSASGYTSHTQPQMSVEALIRRRLSHGGQNHQENERIIRMSTEVSRAKNIVISSIISPNDLRKDKIRFRCDESSVTADQRDKIEKFYSEFFEERFALSTTLSKWIDVALYRTGAKVLILLPMGSLEQEMLGKESFGTESYFKASTELEKKSIFGFGDDILDEDIATIANESFSDTSTALTAARAVVKDMPGDEKLGEIDKTKSRSTYRDLVKGIVSKEAFEIIDNPATLRNKSRSAAMSQQALQKKIEQYRKGAQAKPPKVLAQFVHTGKDSVGEPLFLEAAAEACIPIYVPGSPTNHVAYLFPIDEHGNIARVDPNMAGNESGYGFEEQDKANFSAIYGAFGFNNAMHRQSAIGSTVSHIYSKIVETFLSQKVEKSGLSGLNLGSNPAVYRYMFGQYMAQRQVRMIFVPADMVTYFAFEHDEHGCGVSKLDDVKFALSLKTTADIARAMNFVSSSMPRRNITLDTDDKNTQYHLQTMAKIRDADIQKQTFSLTSNPDNTIGQMAERAYTFKINGGAGYNWSIQNEAHDRGNAVIDDDFVTEKTRDIVLGLEVPPAAMNQLSEGEYSRSVATVNLLFANVILEKQKITLRYTGEFCQKYATYSEFFQSRIREIMGFKTQEEVAAIPGEAGSMTEEDGKSTAESRLADIIASTVPTLPTPRVAPDSAQFENSTAITEWVTHMVDGLWSDDLAGEGAEAKQGLAIKRALVKLKTISKFLGEIGMPDVECLDVNNVSDAEMLSLRQMLTGSGKAVSQQDAALTPPPPEGDVPAGDGNDFSSFDNANQ